MKQKVSISIDEEKIKLLEKMRNDPGMLMKTKDRPPRKLERPRNILETKGLNENPGML